MATANILHLNVKSIMLTSFKGLKTNRTNAPCLSSHCKISEHSQIKYDLGRQRLSNAFLMLHSAAMIARKNSLKSRSSSEGEASMEIEPIIEDGASNSGTSSRGIGHHINRFSKWVVSAIFAAVVIWRHDAGVIWAVVGSVLNTSNSKLLKRIFKQQRPPSALGLKADPGMPSSHAQSLGYLTLYAALSWIDWQGLTAFNIGCAFAILICGAYLTWLRVSEGLHSYDQVLVGALFGSLTAIIWFWLWKEFMLKAFTSFLWVRIALCTGSLIAVIGFLCVVFQTWRFGEI
ncbi:lipid phosphate phosphatase epsilon 2, chloroplastic isoform X1 [Cryptomeria japonica]|uniref:lipid phosphate phosphatase epsilon 2, chloroplastic isoform X1 n=1 Tax=Cryptomeria japonica TaxID=3369 RepID=UPI0027DA3EBB|nr:lipid phosphate phosphatase epsilon 2, chloroplastic isoform X1 [Cryptomeria japonica]